MLKTLEPGMGYSKFKQWVVENQLVFETFTKDQLTVRDRGLREGKPPLRIFVRFCGGDDYAGRASSITIQQYFSDPGEALATMRDSVEYLNGPSVEGKMAGTFGVRRDRGETIRVSPLRGLALIQEADKDKPGTEIGLFADSNFMLQIIRKKEAICN